MEDKKLVEGKYLMYKDKPLVREGDTICYGDMSEKCILVLEIMSYKKVGNEDIPDDIFWSEQITNNNADALAEDRLTAISKMAEIEKIYKELPHLDCGSCGAPNCHALAEDIIKCEAKHEDCLINLRDNR